MSFDTAKKKFELGLDLPIENMQIKRQNSSYSRQKSCNSLRYFGWKQFNLKQNSKSRTHNAIYAHARKYFSYDIQPLKHKSITFLNKLLELYDSYPVNLENYQVNK